MTRVDGPLDGSSARSSRSVERAAHDLITLPADIAAAPVLPEPRKDERPHTKPRDGSEGQPDFLVETSDGQRRAYDLIGEASYSVEEKDPERACALLREALLLDPDDVAITRQAHRGDLRYGTYRRLASLQLKLGRPDEALSTYGILLARLPHPDGEIWAELAEAWEAKGDRERALEYFWTAAKQGCQRWGDDWRLYLHDAIRRLVPEESRRAEFLDREVREFNDWIAWRHRAEVSRSCGDDPPTRDLAAGLEASTTARRHALEALSRSEAISGRRDEELRKRLEQELASDEGWLEDERNHVRESAESR